MFHVELIYCYFFAKYYEVLGENNTRGRLIAMKRTLTILTALILLTGALFAADSYLPGGNAITLNTTVKPVEPVFKFYGSMAGDFTSSAVVTGGETLNTGMDLTKENDSTFHYAVRANFKLTQTNLARYSGKLKITFTATPFSAEINTEKYEAKNIKATVFNHVNLDAYSTDIIEFNSTHIGGTDTTIKCTLDYKKPTPIDKDTDMVSVYFEWLPDATLPASPDYKATVSVIIAPTT